MAEQQPAQEGTKQGAMERQSEKPRLVVVELAKRRTPDQVRLLRKGRGKLVADIEGTLEELVGSGTISAATQPVVIVVREAMLMPLLDLDDSDDDDEEDDEDD
jgi:hypothetical protein